MSFLKQHKGYNKGTNSVLQRPPNQLLQRLWGLKEKIAYEVEVNGESWKHGANRLIVPVVVSGSSLMRTDG